MHVCVYIDYTILQDSSMFIHKFFCLLNRRSARNRRRAEHKKWRLKEGSEFEDFALIGAMAKTITYVDGLRGNTNALSTCIMQPVLHFLQ